MVEIARKQRGFAALGGKIRATYKAPGRGCNRPRHGTEMVAPMQTRLYREGQHWVVDETTGCWMWKGYINCWGYGIASIGNSRTRAAHRVVWQQHTGLTLTRHIHLHHRCHNKPCVNPDHLEPVTATRHARMHIPDKSARFSPDGVALTAAQVLEIRERAAVPGVLLQDLANEYGRSGMVITAICLGKAWQDVGGPIGIPARGCLNCGKSLANKMRHAKYCSRACCTAWWFKQNPEKARQIRDKANAKRRAATA